MAIAVHKSPRHAMDRYGDLLDGLEAALSPGHGIRFTEEDKRNILGVLKAFRVEIPSSAAPVPFKSYNPTTHFGYGPPVALDRGFYFPHTHPDYKKFYSGSSSPTSTSTSPSSFPLADQHRKTYRSPAPSPPPSTPRRNHPPQNALTPRDIHYTDVYGRPISPDVVAKFHGEAPKPRAVTPETDKVESARIKSLRASPTSFVDPKTGAGEMSVVEEKYDETDAHDGEGTKKVAVKVAQLDKKEKTKAKRNDQGKEDIIMQGTPGSPNEHKDKSKTTQESATSQDSHTQDSQTQKFTKATANIKQKRAAPPTTPTTTATAQAQPITAPWPPASPRTQGPDTIRNLRVDDEATINRTLQRGSPFASASTGASFYNPFGEDEADDDVDTDEDTEEEEEEDCTPRTIQSTQPTQESPQTGSLLGKRGRDFDEFDGESEKDHEADIAKEALRFASPGSDMKQSKRFKKD